MYQEQVNNRERVCRWKFETWERMKKALKAYGAVLRLVRRLPKDTRPYYAKYARENFVNYREVDAADPNALNDLFNRTYTHSLWVLNKLIKEFNVMDLGIFEAICETETAKVPAYGSSLRRKNWCVWGANREEENRVKRVGGRNHGFLGARFPPMADSEGFGEDHLSGGSFSQLLFSDDVVGLDIDESFAYSPSFSNEKPPKMLCFGGYQSEVGKNEMGQAICRCQPRAASPKLRREVRETLRRPNRRIPRPAAMSRSEKQTTPFACRIFLLGLPLSLQSTSLFSAKFKYQVKKEKLGERITALQQLVSPFGKTDTASVLHEAMGYIRFLQDQVAGVVFSILANPAFIGPHEGGENGEEKSSKDLRSRGLCLVPVECTEHVANNNGADYWSPAMANTSSKK
uniref:BHLH domain-containing protein n=1 Tax=Vitis vinifera TaxID=29760 RepID=A5BB37_VITVI|nr:hypothetical protein VITISV_006021 [Vitis vinifera]